ncbi:MAG: T9SS type A sorting domain-containing protein [Bacteroidetes bacterium]|nr:T9SS type A sorting domain-containing protein [Bacteroidota bacterium]
MKKNIIIFLSVLISSCFYHQGKAQCTWSTLGGAAVSTSTDVGQDGIIVRVNPADNLTYAIYLDQTNGGKLTAAKYTGSTWQSFGIISSTYAGGMDFTFDNSGTPYVVYSDGGASNAPTVKKYNGSSWVLVGSGPVIATGSSYNSIKVNSLGEPYIAYSDQNNSYIATVMKYNGSTWQAVGTNSISVSYAYNTVLAFDKNDVPYVAFTDGNASYLTTVSMLSGSTWTNVGTPGITGTGNNCTIMIDNNNVPYLAFADANNGYKLGVLTYSAGVWSALGSVLPTAPNGVKTYPSPTVAGMFDKNNTLYIAYLDNTNGTDIDVVRYYNTSWQFIGSAGMPQTSQAGVSITMNNNGDMMLGSACSTSSPQATPYVYTMLAPTIGTQPFSQTVCTNAASQFVVQATSNNGSNVLSYQWQVFNGTNYNAASGAYYTGATTASLSIPSSTVTTQYHVLMDDGCLTRTSNTASLSLLSLPTVSITGPGHVCHGGSATLTATGATSYTWSTGATTTSITITPSVATTYTVTGSNGTCSNTANLLFAVLGSKNLNGAVTSTAGVVNGIVILYQYSSILSKWDSITNVAITGSAFNFGPIDSARYVVKAVPTATNMQITYGISANSWQGATVINHGCMSNSSQTIQVNSYTSLGSSGSGSMSGTIYEGTGYGHKAAGITGQPIPGVIVKGGKNPGAQIFAQTNTDNGGHYSFVNLPDNNPGESYFILVDIPGLDTNQTYHEVLTLSNNSLGGLDFVVDSMYVNPFLTSSVNEINKADYLIEVFPNPASKQFQIGYSLLQNTVVSAEITDMTGRHIATAIPETYDSPGDHKQLVDIRDLKQGIYFIWLRMDQRQTCIKLIVTE